MRAPGMTVPSSGSMSGNHETGHLSWSARALLAALALALPSAATATVYSCNEAGLDAGLSAGGLVQFGCASGSTIPITSSKTVAVSGTIIDGQDHVTFQGSPGFRLFVVASGTSATFRNLTITGANLASLGAVMSCDAGTTC